jgi:thiamine biosynthesis lipoprotein
MGSKTHAIFAQLAPAAAGRIRRVDAIMGTTFDLDVRDAAGEVDSGTIDDAFRWLHDVDRRFSPYRPDSEVSRLNRGELETWQASADVQFVLAECEAMRPRTNGWFDARPKGPHGPLDPSGYVKGWALERASAMIAAAGARNFSLNGGGDVVVRGFAAPGEPWRVGIRNPLVHDRVAAVIAVSDLAVATSGTYERGDHIVDPHTGRPPDGLLAVTVVGASITIADVFATAAFAMGHQGATWVARQSGYEACAITADERVVTTPGFEALRVRE